MLLLLRRISPFEGNPRKRRMWEEGWFINQ